jgi:hypothetical protein
MTDEEFVKWKIERDKAISGTFEEFKAYVIKIKQIPPEVMEIMYHKGRTTITSLPNEIREASNTWLVEHGYSGFKQ